MATKFIVGNTLIAPTTISDMVQSDHTGNLVFDNKDYKFDGTYPSISKMVAASAAALRPRNYGYMRGG